MISMSKRDPITLTDPMFPSFFQTIFRVFYAFCFVIPWVVFFFAVTAESQMDQIQFFVVANFIWSAYIALWLVRRR